MSYQHENYKLCTATATPGNGIIKEDCQAVLLLANCWLLLENVILGL